VSAGGEVRVGVAEPAEFAETGALSVAAYEEFSPHMEPAAWERMRDSLSDVRALAEESIVLVARDGGGVVGALAYYPPGRTLQPLPAEWASVRNVAVAPSTRGRGVGHRLMEACVARAREDGAAVLGLYTTTMMAAAVALYERLGFVRDVELPPRHGFPCYRYRLDLVAEQSDAAGVRATGD